MAGLLHFGVKMRGKILFDVDRVMCSYTSIDRTTSYFIAHDQLVSPSPAPSNPLFNGKNIILSAHYLHTLHLLVRHNMAW
jgi:hypothetical protein